MPGGIYIYTTPNVYREIERERERKRERERERERERDRKRERRVLVTSSIYHLTSC